MAFLRHVEVLMRILIADDDRVTRLLLERLISHWGHQVLVAVDGEEAWRALQASPRPQLAVLDWMMPGHDGVDICRKLQEVPESDRPHVILLTARDGTRDIVAGLEAGAHDYIVKPFKQDELRVRIQVGVRIVELQERLKDQLAELKQAISRVRRLHGLLPICSYCKKVRTDQQYWQQLDMYLVEHSDVQVSHGICPTCFEQYAPMFDAPSTDVPVSFSKET